MKSIIRTEYTQEFHHQTQPHSIARTSQRARMIPTDLLASSSDVTCEFLGSENRRRKRKVKGSAKPHMISMMANITRLGVVDDRF